MYLTEVSVLERGVYLRGVHLVESFYLAEVSLRRLSTLERYLSLICLSEVSILERCICWSVV